MHRIFFKKILSFSVFRHKSRKPRENLRSEKKFQTGIPHLSLRGESENYTTTVTFACKKQSIFFVWSSKNRKKQKGGIIIPSNQPSVVIYTTTIYTSRSISLFFLHILNKKNLIMLKMKKRLPKIFIWWFSCWFSRSKHKLCGYLPE